MKFLYLSIDAFTLLGPLILSFDKRVSFYKKWKPLFLAISIMMIIFIPWDILKTDHGVWGFNQDYICGIYFFNLPIEECLFFVCIPYACIFIYECLNYYLKKDLLLKFHRPLILFLSILLIIIGIYSYPKLYPTVTFPYAATLLLITLFYFKVKYFSRFIFSYFVTLIPFFIVNGILTGSFLDEPIVWYSSNEILNIRLGTIPIEDTIYNLGMLTTVIIPYEFFKKKKLISQ